MKFIRELIARKQHGAPEEEAVAELSNKEADGYGAAAVSDADIMSKLNDIRLRNSPAQPDEELYTTDGDDLGTEPVANFADVVRDARESHSEPLAEPSAEPSQEPTAEPMIEAMSAAELDEEFLDFDEEIEDYENEVTYDDDDDFDEEVEASANEPDEGKDEDEDEDDIEMEAEAEELMAETAQPEIFEASEADAPVQIEMDADANEMLVQKMAALREPEEPEAEITQIAQIEESVEQIDSPEIDTPAVLASVRPISEPRKIWDMQADSERPSANTDAAANPQTAEGAAVIDVNAAVPMQTKPRAGRVKTRLLGFNLSEDTADPFAAPAENKPAAQSMFPVGWIIVASGPGRGNAFQLCNGVSQIGRGDDQAIKLDFGDTSISRSSHAAIAYDGEQRSFFLGHGGKANLVRLNGKPVLSTEELVTGDLVRIGETTLRMVALCGADFDWGTEDQEDANDAAIA